jgi:hypothetical protein
MIRRALLIAAAAVALSAAGAMAFTPSVARAGRSWSLGILRTTFGLTLDPRSTSAARATNGSLLQQDDAVQGSFCPVRPPVHEPTPLIPEASGAQMSTDPQASAAIDSSTLSEGESLLPPSSALCRAGSVTPPSQSGAGH